MADLNSLTVTISLKNDAGITPEMVQALEECVDNAADVWRNCEGEDIAREALRRLWIATTGKAPDEESR